MALWAATFWPSRIAEKERFKGTLGEMPAS